MSHIGLKCKLYQGAAGQKATGELTIAKDVKLGLEKGEADISSRASAWELIKATMKKATIDFSFNWNSANTQCTALKAAFFGDTPLAFFVADEAGNGLDADFELLKFDMDQPLKDGVKVDVSIKPTYVSRYPAWVDAQQGGG